MRSYAMTVMAIVIIILIIALAVTNGLLIIPPETVSVVTSQPEASMAFVGVCIIGCVVMRCYGSKKRDRAVKWSALHRMINFGGAVIKLICIAAVIHTDNSSKLNWHAAWLLCLVTLRWVFVFTLGLVNQIQSNNQPRSKLGVIIKRK